MQLNDGIGTTCDISTSGIFFETESTHLIGDTILANWGRVLYFDIWRAKRGRNLFMRPRIRRPICSQSDFNNDPHREESRVTSRFRSGQNNGSMFTSADDGDSSSIRAQSVSPIFDHPLVIPKDRVFAAH